MSDAPKIHVGTNSSPGSSSGLARAVTDGVRGAADAIATSRSVRIGTLRIDAGSGADPRQVSEAVRREIARAVARMKP